MKLCYWLTVTRVDWHHAEQGRQWVVASKSEGGHLTETHHDFIVIATGHAFVPRIPLIKVGFVLCCRKGLW